MSQFIRADALLEFDEAAQDLGGDPDGLLAAAGLVPAHTRIAGRHLPRRGFSVALELAAAQLARPDFGMLLGRRQTMHVLGGLALAMENAATLGEALQLLERYMHSHDQAAHISQRLLPRSDRHLLSFFLSVRGAKAVVQNHELGLVLACDAMARLAGESFCPLEIRMAHAPLGDPAHYARYFPCPVLFSQPASGVVLSRAALETPLLRRNVNLAQLAHHHLYSQLGDGSLSMTQQIERLILPLIKVGRCSINDVARFLALHPRTLRRRLCSEGTSFAEIKDTQRRLRAAELVAQGLPLGYMTGLLGYANESGLSRSLKRWFGRSVRK